MNKPLLTLCIALIGTVGCNSNKQAASSKNANGPNTQQIPFSLALVPTTNYGEPLGAGIEMARKFRYKPRYFYVVLTNVSNQTQAVWEYWNSWGYQTISFELTNAQGKKFVVARRQEGFTKNAPTTFLVDPGEHQLYAVSLDEWWESHPQLPKADGMPITLKAVYQVSPTPESTQYKVWTGRIESRSHSLQLRVW